MQSTIQLSSIGNQFRLHCVAPVTAVPIYSAMIQSTAAAAPPETYLLICAVHRFYFLFQILPQILPQMQPELSQKRRQSQRYEKVSGKINIFNFVMEILMKSKKIKISFGFFTQIKFFYNKINFTNYRFYATKLITNDN